MEATGCSDNELISASLVDPEKFGEVFRRYRVDVFRFMSRRVGDEAADLTGEVFKKAFQLRSGFDSSHESCRPWLYGIASNVVGDYLRHKRVRDRRQALVMHEVDRDIDPYHAVTEAIAMRAARDPILRALDQLRGVDRNILLLVALEGLSYSETAQALSIPVGTVRSRLSRARTRLRQQLPPDVQALLNDDSEQ